MSLNKVLKVAVGACVSAWVLKTVAKYSFGVGVGIGYIAGDNPKNDKIASKVKKALNDISYNDYRKALKLKDLKEWPTIAALEYLSYRDNDKTGTTVNFEKAVNNLKNRTDEAEAKKKEKAAYYETPEFVKAAEKFYHFGDDTNEGNEIINDICERLSLLKFDSTITYLYFSAALNKNLSNCGVLRVDEVFNTYSKLYSAGIDGAMPQKEFEAIEMKDTDKKYGWFIDKNSDEDHKLDLKFHIDIFDRMWTACDFNRPVQLVADSGRYKFDEDENAEKDESDE